MSQNQGLSPLSSSDRYYSQPNYPIYNDNDNIVVEDEERGADSCFEPFSKLDHSSGVSGALDYRLLECTDCNIKVLSTPASKPYQHIATMTERSHLTLPGQQRPRSASSISNVSSSSIVSSTSDNTNTSRTNLNSIFDTGLRLSTVSPLDAIAQKYSSMMTNKSIEYDVEPDTDDGSDTLFFRLKRQRR